MKTKNENVEWKRYIPGGIVAFTVIAIVGFCQCRVVAPIKIYSCVVKNFDGDNAHIECKDSAEQNSTEPNKGDDSLNLDPSKLIPKAGATEGKPITYFAIKGLQKPK